MSATADCPLQTLRFLARPVRSSVRAQHKGRAVAGENDGRWEAWMVAAQAGDARAYDLLLRDCLPLLRAIARRRIRDTYEAEDAVQDTLLTIHRMIATYDPDRPLRPWIVAIAERRCVDRLRRRGRGAGRESPIDDHAESLAAPDGQTGEERIAEFLSEQADIMSIYDFAKRGAQR